MAKSISELSFPQGIRVEEVDDLQDRIVFPDALSEDAPAITKVLTMLANAGLIQLERKKIDRYVEVLLASGHRTSHKDFSISSHRGERCILVNRPLKKAKEEKPHAPATPVAALSVSAEEAPVVETAAAAEAPPRTIDVAETVRQGMVTDGVAVQPPEANAPELGPAEPEPLPPTVILKAYLQTCFQPLVAAQKIVRPGLHQSTGSGENFTVTLTIDYKKPAIGDEIERIFKEAIKPFAPLTQLKAGKRSSGTSFVMFAVSQPRKFSQALEAARPDWADNAVAKSEIDFQLDFDKSYREDRALTARYRY